MGRPMPLRNPAGYRGLRENLTALLGSFAEFCQTRLELAARESKAAMARLLVLFGCLVGAAIFSLSGYLFLLAFAVCGLAYLLKVWWIWVALGFALLHFGAALLCLIIARAQGKHPMFRETTSVLKEDSAWLKNLDESKTR
jgi:uncharacterized membrane protein YqjE